MEKELYRERKLFDIIIINDTSENMISESNYTKLSKHFFNFEKIHYSLFYLHFLTIQNKTHFDLGKMEAIVYVILYIYI